MKVYFTHTLPNTVWRVYMTFHRKRPVSALDSQLDKP